MYATDRGADELEQRRGEETVTLAWLADRLRAHVDRHPGDEAAIERLATELARDAGEDD